MAIEEKTYQMCNYSTSKIVVALRDSSIIIEGGRRDAPTIYPFTMSELQHINNTSPFIKCGYLIPVETDKKYIYESLRVMDWESILTDEQIEQIILTPTVESLNRLLNIKDSLYFERVYGAFIGLKNVNAPISANVVRLISGRYKEIKKGKISTGFTVTAKDIPSVDGFKKCSDNNDKSDKLKEAYSKIEELTKLVEKLTTGIDSTKLESGIAIANSITTIPKTRTTSKSRKTTTKTEKK